MALKNMKPITKTKTAKQSVYGELKKAILNGSISTETMLTETILSETLETSRTPIREAVADLIRDGLLVQVPRKGFHVRQVTNTEMEQIMFLRVSIEMEGLRKLVSIISPSQIEQLKDIVEKQEVEIKKNDAVRFIELDQEFHRSILQFSNQNLLKQVLEESYDLTILIGHNALMKEGRMLEVIWEHKNIINAMENKDDQSATTWMKQHLETTKNIVQEHG